MRQTHYSSTVYASFRGTCRRHIHTQRSIRSFNTGSQRNVAIATPKDTVPVSDSPAPAPPLARMPTGYLMRSMLLSSIMSSRTLLAPCLVLLKRIATSDSFLFNPDKNPLLEKLLRMTIYKQFCAGANAEEVNQTVGLMRQMGYRGIILGYCREIVLNEDGKPSSNANGYNEKHLEALKQWQEGTLKTLSMIGPGDFLAIKFTGAGPIAVNALKAGEKMPSAIQEVMDQVCEETRKKGSRLWLDAEQQALQHTVDDWSIELMRKFNKNGDALVYNTIQAYLKASKANVARHVKLAAEEGWALGIKLVRGAYIEHETRSLIHDTKEDTDKNFDEIASDLINHRLPASNSTTTKPLPSFPKTQLFIASHNAESFKNALSQHRARLQNRQPTIMLEFGQLQGMADEIGCEILHDIEAIERQMGAFSSPRMFKFLPWGTLSESLAYLHRRSVENKGAIGRTKDAAVALRRELQRRLFA